MPAAVKLRQDHSAEASQSSVFRAPICPRHLSGVRSWRGARAAQRRHQGDATASLSGFASLTLRAAKSLRNWKPTVA